MSKHVTVAMLCGLASGMVGCTASTPTGGTLQQRLQDENPSVRIDAIVQAAEQNDRTVLPLLVDRLNDSQRDVRFFAGLALEQMLGPQRWKRFGWVSWDPPAQREQAIEKLRNWLERQRAGDSADTKRFPSAS